MPSGGESEGEQPSAYSRRFPSSVWKTLISAFRLKVNAQKSQNVLYYMEYR